MSFKVGDTVADYEVVAVLGTGGMGQVYKVRNTLSNRFEAMKVLLPGSLATADTAERFLREIRVQASLDHPNIAALRTALHIDNQIVMIMELVEGTTLQAILSSGPLPLKLAVDFMCQALSALSYAHERGVIHRDIKPGNIMLTRDAVVKLTDFGVAKVIADRSLRSISTLGTVHYMSPEQVKGSSTLDARSDLYSLGVTLYECVTGSRPFEGDSDFAVLSAQCNEAPVPPQQKKAAVPMELNQAILKSLAKDPADRFQTAAEFREALQNVRGLPEEAPIKIPVAVPEVTSAPAGRSVGTSPPVGSRLPTSPSSTSRPLEMAYVLFMDIVAYSTLPMDRQSERIQQLVEIVRNTESFRIAQESDQLISLPTGDGMALVFFQNPVAPVQCATEISRALRNQPELKLRMGIHTGPVYRIPDINTNRNVAGGGINMAQRVMDCGDAGHILVSKTVADTLSQLSDWTGSLHDLGEAEVKHGVKVHIVNFYTAEVGNPETPKKLQQSIAAQQPIQPQTSTLSPRTDAVPISAPIPSAIPPPATRRNIYWAAGIGILAAAIIAVAGIQLSHQHEGIPARNPAAPATLSPVQPSAPRPPATPPPTPTSPIAVVPPSGPPRGMIPPSSTSPAPTPGSTSSPASGSSGALTPVPKKPAPVPQQPSEQAVSSPIPAKPEPQAVQPPSTLPPPSVASTLQSAPGANAPNSADRAAQQELRERMILLAGRAGAIRGSLENLQRQQRQAGLSLRPDMAAAKESLDYLMGEARTSLAAGDTATTKRNLDLAEQQVEKLERFLGR